MAYLLAIGMLLEYIYTANWHAARNPFRKLVILKKRQKADQFSNSMPTSRRNTLAPRQMLVDM
jgi:hypothetical protein